MKKQLLKSLFVSILLLSFLTIGITSTYANETASKDHEQQWWFKKDNPDREKLPPLEGGPEQNERQVPISNIILQQQYPETVVLQGPTTENRIAITFDDGPDPRFTERVLDVLADYNVPATFFLMGSRAVAYPEIVQRIQNEGHIIGNHSYYHPNLVQEGDLATLEREITRTEDALADIIGYRTKLFRAPYGFLYGELVEKLAEMTYSVVGWSVDSLDWREQPPEEIVNIVLNNVHPGGIILMHDGGDWEADRTFTIESLRIIIPALQEQGFEFVTVPDLLNIPYQK